MITDRTESLHFVVLMNSAAKSYKPWKDPEDKEAERQKRIAKSYKVSSGESVLKA